MKAPGWFTRENIEWAARLYRFVRNRPLTRYGGLLFIGALALYSNIIQLIIVGLFLLVGKQVSIPDTPQGVFYSMMVTGFLLVVLDRVLPERSIFPIAYPHDQKLMAKIRDT